MMSPSKTTEEDFLNKPEVLLRTPIEEVLVRIADETHRLLQSARKLEDDVSSLLTNRSASELTNLQTVDSLRQELEGLAFFLSSLIKTMDANGNCLPYQAASELLLEDQVKRLCGILDENTDMVSRETVLWASVGDFDSTNTESNSNVVQES